MFVNALGSHFCRKLIYECRPSSQSGLRYYSALNIVSGAYKNTKACLCSSIVTQDANVSAIYCGVATPVQAKRALTYLQLHCSTPFGPLTCQKDDPTMTSYVSPFATFRHLMAFWKLRDDQSVLTTIRTLWGQMLTVGPG